MIVEWKEDLRPMPDEVPSSEYEGLLHDPELIKTYRGMAVSSCHKIFKGWVFLVYCEDKVFREVEVGKVKVLDS